MATYRGNVVGKASKTEVREFADLKMVRNENGGFGERQMKSPSSLVKSCIRMFVCTFLCFFLCFVVDIGFSLLLKRTRTSTDRASMSPEEFYNMQTANAFRGLNLEGEGGQDSNLVNPDKVFHPNLLALIEEGRRNASKRKKALLTAKTVIGEVSPIIARETAYQVLIEAERNSECILPKFHAEDASLLPNISKVVLRGCGAKGETKKGERQRHLRDDALRKEMATLKDGRLKIETVNVCSGGGKYSKIQEDGEADGLKSLLWIPFEGQDENLVVSDVRDEYVVIKCHTKNAMIEKILVQAPPPREHVSKLPFGGFPTSLLGNANIINIAGQKEGRMEGGAQGDTPTSEPKRDPQGRPNVLLVVLDAVSDRHFQRTMPLTNEWLRSMAYSKQQRNHPRKFSSFHFQRHHAFHGRYTGNIASMFSGLSTKHLVNALQDEEEKVTWLWDVFKQNGYNVAMNENGCTAGRRSLLRATRVSQYIGSRKRSWSDSVDSVGLQTLSCHLSRDDPHLTSFSFGTLEMCVHGRRYHSYFLEHMRLYFDAYADSTPVFYTLQLNEGRDPSMKRLVSMDRALRNALESVLANYPNTVLTFASTEGIAVGKYFESTETGYYERSLPFLHMVFPTTLYGTSTESLFADISQNAGQLKLTTHGDIYHTLTDLITNFKNGKSSYHAEPFAAEDEKVDDPPVHLISLLRPRYLVHRHARRNCASAGIISRVCACVSWEETSENMVGVAEYALSQVNGDLWLRTENSFSGCQPLRLSTVVRKFKMVSQLKPLRKDVIRPQMPIRQRYRVELTTRSGDGYGQERFVFEVSVVKWEFRILHRPNINDLDLKHSAFHLMRKFRMSPMQRYQKCLGPNDHARDLAFCICNIGRADDAVYFFGEESNDHNAALVRMIKQDDVELVRWTHGSAEQLEVINHRSETIIFQIAIRHGSSKNVRASSVLPVWVVVPSNTRQPLVTLEQADMNRQWQWNFDWRWNLLPANKPIIPKPTLLLGNTFSSTNIHFQYANGVALLKYIDVFSEGEHALYYQAKNYRSKALRLTASITVAEESKQLVVMPKSTIVKVTMAPGKEVSICRIAARQKEPANAKVALNHVQFHVEWKVVNN